MSDPLFQKFASRNPHRILDQPLEWAQWMRKETGCPVYDMLDFAARYRMWHDVMEDPGNTESVKKAMTYLMRMESMTKL